MTDDDDARYEDELRAELRAALERDQAPSTAPSSEEPPAPEPSPAPAQAPAPTSAVLVDDAPDDDPPDDAPGGEVAPDDEDGDGERDARQPRTKPLQNALEWAAVVIGALVVALVVKTFLFQAFYIPSSSMEPTLEKGDRVLVNKVSYDVHDVHRGDVIVFEIDEEDVGPDGIKDLIKRVIGLPGDVIESRDGVVYVNDRALEEPYLAEGMVTGDPEDGRNPPIERQTVPEGHVFVLGDNRSNSADSRYPYRGPIPIDDIVGRAFVLIWPLNDLQGL